MDEKAIVKNETRVLTPFEYSQLRNALEDHKYKTICDVLINTGMRISEFWELCRHPEWYDVKRRCIDLPGHAVKKAKTVYGARTIPLTLDGCNAVEELFRVNPKYITRQSMIGVLELAAINAKIAEGDKGIMPKMFRKSLISWLMKTYPEKVFVVAASSGHTFDVMQRHYASLSFQRQDIEDMKKFLKGWGEA
jgi:integrase